MKALVIRFWGIKKPNYEIYVVHIVIHAGVSNRLYFFDMKSVLIP